MDYQIAAKAAAEAGFTHTAPLDPATIVLKEEVRQMCAACGRYENCWSCPPGCGCLEECRERVAAFRQGILVQTVGVLEDEFDGEGMMETEALHKANFQKLRQTLKGENILALGAGSCTVCKKCTYPDESCRFPEKRISSMEAYGMVVTEVCRANGMTYHYGKNTITYTSCVLF